MIRGGPGQGQITVWSDNIGQIREGSGLGLDQTGKDSGGKQDTMEKGIIVKEAGHLNPLMGLVQAQEQLKKSIRNYQTEGDGPLSYEVLGGSGQDRNKGENGIIASKVGKKGHSAYAFEKMQQVCLQKLNQDH